MKVVLSTLAPEDVEPSTLDLVALTIGDVFKRLGNLITNTGQ